MPKNTRKDAAIRTGMLYSNLRAMKVPKSASVRVVPDSLYRAVSAGPGDLN
jgi:hypothetical protein